MKRYELKKIADGGLLYIEESDILAVRPRKGDHLHPIEIELRNRDAYRIDEGFYYHSKSRTVTIRLSLRQAKGLIEQDRTEQGKDFCENCFDFGTSADPEECARCRTLLAMHQAGYRDMRKIRIPLPRPQGWRMPVALLLAILLFWWTLCQWTAASVERDQARAELAAVRRIKQVPLPKGAR